VSRDATDPDQPANPPHYHGHRERLRQRLLEAGPEALADYELIELVLALAIPRRDTKPAAKALLEVFGDLPGVIAASPERLKQVKGIGDAAVAALKLVQGAAVRLAQRQVLNKPVLRSWDALIDYCHSDMARRDTEAFRVLFLDRKNVLIADEVQEAGTVDHTPVYIREVVKRALSLGASALILVHNHPSGDPSPSRDDIEMTRRVAEAAKPLGVLVHDHVVIGRQGHYSFRANGLI